MFKKLLLTLSVFLISLFLFSNNVSASRLTTEEIFEKTGKTISQTAINDCYSHNMNYMLVFSENRTSQIGNYALYCMTGPMTFYSYSSVEEFGYAFYIDDTFQTLQSQGISPGFRAFMNGTTACSSWWGEGQCSLLGRNKPVTIYFSNFDLLHGSNDNYSLYAGQVKFACNADTCLSISVPNEELVSSSVYTYSTDTLPSDVVDFLNDDSSYEDLNLGDSGIVWQVGGHSYSVADNYIFFTSFNNSSVNFKFYDEMGYNRTRLCFYDSSGSRLQNLNENLFGYVLYYNPSINSYSWVPLSESSISDSNSAFFNSYTPITGNAGAFSTILKRSIDIVDENDNIVFEHNWNTLFELPAPAYDYSYEISPYNYNYAYIKFKGLGNLEIYINNIIESSTRNYQSLSVFKNNNPLLGPIILSSSNDFSFDSSTFEEYFSNCIDTDIYTIVFYFNSTSDNSFYSQSDLLTINFTVPGLIEYGNDQIIYKLITDNLGNVSFSEDVPNRSDITDLLEPPPSTPEEIISNPSSTNTLTNDSLNEFSWPYSLFSRDGANISDIKLSASYSNTSSLNINNFDNRLIINYGSEVYKINLNNCMLNNQCDLTSYEKTLIKRILFDREVELSDEYLSFFIKPLIDISTANSAQLNVGLSLEFSSSVELTISSFLLAINEISDSNYNIYFKLYDSLGTVHTLYKTALNSSNHLGVNQFQLDNRTADIFKVELMFVYNQTSNNFSSLDSYHLDFSEFNIFANTDLVHIYTDNTNITYQTCAWNNFFCHIQNGFTWLVYEAPILKDFWTLLLKITNIFNVIWTLLTYIFMPLDIIPPILGVDISDLALSICALYLIVKLWIGGKS